MPWISLSILCLCMAVVLLARRLHRVDERITDLARSLRQLQIPTQAILPTQNLSQTSALSLGICDEHGVCLPNQSGKPAWDYLHFVPTEKN